MKNIAKAIAVLNTYTTGDVSDIYNYVASDMIEHDLRRPTGMIDFAKFIISCDDRPVITIVRSFEDGDHVVLHCHYQYSHKPAEVGFEVFRFENGMVAEHWNNISTQATPNRSGRTQLDGTTEISSCNDALFFNKKVAEGFVREILMHKENYEKYPMFFFENEHIEHNLYGADTVQAIVDLFKKDKTNSLIIAYKVLHKVLGQGDHVLTISEGTWAGVATCFYDLFRIKDGKIREHWDVIEKFGEIAPALNGNSKF